MSLLKNPPSVSVTVTSLAAVSDWSFASPLVQAEQKLLTFICAEYTIVIVSPCSIVPAIPPVWFASVTLVIFGPTTTVKPLFSVVTPPSGLVTVTLRAPSAALPAIDTVTVSWVGLLNTVGARDAGSGERHCRAGDEAGTRDA